MQKIVSTLEAFLAFNGTPTNLYFMGRGSDGSLIFQDVAGQTYTVQVEDVAYAA